jgi:hypothetical protein
MSQTRKIALAASRPPDRRRPTPQFAVGQRVRVKQSPFVTARRGVVAELEWRRKFAPGQIEHWWCYWLQDGGFFSANELEAD